VQWTLFRSALKAGPSQAGWQDSTIWLGHAAVTSATHHYAAERYARGGVGQAGAQAAPFDAWIDDWRFSTRPGAVSPWRICNSGQRRAIRLRPAPDLQPPAGAAGRERLQP
jgi:predicted secreted hydrolase